MSGQLNPRPGTGCNETRLDSAASKFRRESYASPDLHTTTALLCGFVGAGHTGFESRVLVSAGSCSSGVLPREGSRFWIARALGLVVLAAGSEAAVWRGEGSKISFY